jgi:AraC family transcriptional regulator, regulatory protein of adaptative response / DNA-3-methyladenine glycosylase II
VDLVRRTVTLPGRASFDGAAVHRFLAARALTGFESSDGHSYARVLILPGGPAVARIGELASATSTTQVRIELALSAPDDEASARTQVVALLGLAPWLGPARRQLQRHDTGASLLHRFPSTGVPRHPSAYETALRAVVGQQVSVAAARTTLSRLVEAHGTPLPEALTAIGFGPTVTLPAPERLAAADPTTFAMPRSRCETLHAVAAGTATGALALDDPSLAVDERIAALRAVRGVGPWTTGYVRLRGLGDPDVLLSGDLGVVQARKALGLSDADLSALATACAPYRSLLTSLLWRSLG